MGSDGHAASPLLRGARQEPGRGVLGRRGARGGATRAAPWHPARTARPADAVAVLVENGGGAPRKSSTPW